MRSPGTVRPILRRVVVNATARPSSSHLLIDHCGQILTLATAGGPKRGKDMNDLRIVEKGAIEIRDGIIQWIGPRSALRHRQTRGARRLDAGGCVVLPGFVDSHTHALFAGSRVDEYARRIDGATYEDLARGGGGIQASARRLRASTTSALVKHLSHALGLFQRHGTTTVEVKSGYGLEPSQELRMLGAIRSARRQGWHVVPTLLFHDIPAPESRRRNVFVRRMCETLIPTVARRGLAEFCDVFCDRGYFSLAETEALLGSAARAGLNLKLHGEQLTHSGAARLAANMKAVSIDHVDHVTAADMHALARSGTIATLLPGSNLHLGDPRYPPARRLIEAGVPVALATNFNPGTSPTLNMQLILSLACSQMRMTPAEAIAAATINGAYALCRGERIGSLTPGKQADVVITDVADYREIPYYVGMNHCAVVIRNGIVVRDEGGG